MDDLLKRTSKAYNRIIGSLKDKHPVAGKLMMKFYANKHFGLKFMDDDHNIVGEYTVILSEGPEIIKYDKGIDDKVWLTKRLSISVLEEFLDDEDKFVEKPLQSMVTYLPMSFKYILSGDAGLELKFKK